MGAIFMSILVIVIAFAGGIYFTIQDRKASREHHPDSKED
jgi:hypothetical protein